MAAGSGIAVVTTEFPVVFPILRASEIAPEGLPYTLEADDVDVTGEIATCEQLAEMMRPDESTTVSAYEPQVEINASPIEIPGETMGYDCNGTPKDLTPPPGLKPMKLPGGMPPRK